MWSSVAVVSPKLHTKFGSTSYSHSENNKGELPFFAAAPAPAHDNSLVVVWVSALLYMELSKSKLLDKFEGAGFSRCRNGNTDLNVVTISTHCISKQSLISCSCTVFILLDLCYIIRLIIVYFDLTMTYSVHSSAEGLSYETQMWMNVLWTTEDAVNLQLAPMYLTVSSVPVILDIPVMASLARVTQSL